MSSILEPIKALFSPVRPLWACELTSQHVIVTGVDSSRKRIAGNFSTSLPANSLTGSLIEKNLTDPQVVYDLTKQALQRAGFKGFEISVVIPDDSARIAFVAAESLPSAHDERAAFIRWKLKKTIPFDIESAQIAYKVIGSHTSNGESGVDLMVAISPRSVVAEYENLFEKLDVHAGFILPSSLAALNLYQPPEGDSIYVKATPDAITTTIFRGGAPRFYRRVGDMPLYDAVYPTILYYQDKLGGTGRVNLCVCGYDKALSAQLTVLSQRLEIPVKRAEPAGVHDLYKPALGAADYR